MPSRTVKIKVEAEYEFFVNEKNQGKNLATVYRNGSCCGWVTNGDSSGGLPEEVVEQARSYLFEINPEVNPAVILARTQKARGRCPTGTPP